ncbi:MAG: hypothetical protein AAF984_04350, partial [Verrucomicrobiota bacterium]
LGAVYNMTFHGPAIMGRLFQSLLFVDKGYNAFQEVEGTLEIKLSGVESIMAVEEIYPQARGYSFQFFNTAKRGIHKICMTRQGDLEEFLKIIKKKYKDQSFQSSEYDKDTIRGEYEWQIGMNHEDASYCESSQICLSVLYPLFQCAYENHIPLRIEVLHPTLIHSEIFCINSICQRESQITLLDEHDDCREYFLGLDYIGKAVIAKAMGDIKSPTSIHIYNHGGCFCSTITPYLEIGDEKLCVWERTLANQVKSV